jgi:hypothetical protein
MFRATAEGPLVAGKVQHPHPIPGPAGFSRCGEAIDLYFCCESAQGGHRLLGTEGVSVRLFNGGYPLAEVSLELVGRGPAGQQVLQVERMVPELPRGTELRVEIPSYEMSDEVAEVLVTLREAEFALERS